MREIKAVIPSQCSHWRGNPLNLPGIATSGYRPPRNDTLLCMYGEKSQAGEIHLPALLLLKCLREQSLGVFEEDVFLILIRQSGQRHTAELKFGAVAVRTE